MINPFFKNSDLWKPCFVYALDGNLDFGRIAEEPDLPLPFAEKKKKKAEENQGKPPERTQAEPPERSDAGKLQKGPQETKEGPEKRPNPKVQRDRLRQRRENEKLEVYAQHIKNIREAIETPGGGGRLYDFIYKFDRINKDAPGYGDKGNRYPEWNKAFCDHFGLKPVDKETVQKSYTRYAYALQLYLKQEFPKMVASADELFLDLPKKKGVRYVYYDGRIGVYTMSVLAEYWNYKYHPNQKGEEKRKKFQRVLLGKETSKNAGLQKYFKGAMAHLDSELKGEPKVPDKAPEKVFKPKEITELTSEELAKLIALAKKDKGRLKAYREFVKNGGFDLSALPEKDLAKKGGMDQIRKDFLATLEPDVYAKLAEKAGLMVEAKAEPPEEGLALQAEAPLASPGNEPRAKKYDRQHSLLKGNIDRLEGQLKKVQNKEKRVKIQTELDRSKRALKKLDDVHSFMTGVEAVGWPTKTAINSSYEQRQRGDLMWLEERKKKDPTAVFWINNFDDREGSWPDQAFNAYKDFYENLPGDSDIKAGNPQVVERFEGLKSAAAAYPEFVSEVIEQLNKHYEAEIKKKMNQYDLPEGVSPQELSLTVIKETSGRPAIVPNSKYFRQARKIKKSELRNMSHPEYIDRNLYQTYFKSEIVKKGGPTRIPDTWEALEAQLNPDRIDMFVAYLGGGKDKKQEALAQLKEVMLFRNMHHVRIAYDQMKGDYRRDLDDVLGIMDKNYERYKSRNPKERQMIAKSIVRYHFEGGELE